MAGKVVNIKVCSPLKLRSGLTGNYHALCHYSYNLPLATRRRPTHIQAHLVFAKALANMKNQKSLYLGQRNEKLNNHGLFDLHRETKLFA